MGEFLLRNILRDLKSQLLRQSLMVIIRFSRQPEITRGLPMEIRGLTQAEWEPWHLDP